MDLDDEFISKKLPGAAESSPSAANPAAHLRQTVQSPSARRTGPALQMRRSRRTPWECWARTLFLTRHYQLTPVATTRRNCSLPAITLSCVRKTLIPDVPSGHRLESSQNPPGEGSTAGCASALADHSAIRFSQSVYIYMLPSFRPTEKTPS